MSQKEESDAAFGLVGHPLAHSWSTYIHELLGSSPYALHDLEAEDAAKLIRGGTWRGLNVTIPHKRLAAELADEQSPRVKQLGVANTLVRRTDGSLFAENTDVLGFAWMLDRFSRRAHAATSAKLLANKKVLVLGSGGASRAVCAALEDVGARTVVVSRSGEETYAGLPQRHPDAALVVNTTPVGMFPSCPASPLADDVLPSLRELLGVLDVVYNPRRTGLCLAAERLGLPFESGLAMLVSQAFFASELFLGHSLDESLIEAVERKIARRSDNVILIGMPGAGKSSCGRALARLTGRPFVDIDEAIALECGKSAAQIIRDEGEEAFRATETRVVGDYGCRSGLVIACGGGVVTRPENYDLLHQNGTIVFLERPIEELSLSGRPVSQQLGVERIAAERMDLYHGWADVCLPCTGSAEGDASAIKALLEL